MDHDAPRPITCCRRDAAPNATAAVAAAVPLATPRTASRGWRDVSTWRRAARNTLHCLVGCTIGDVAAMTVVPLLWRDVPLSVLMAISIVSGLASSLVLETLVLHRREGMPLPTALRAALGMSLISMVAMELAMNLTDWFAMGGQRLPLHHAGYWLSWIPALLVGFLVPLPYNYLQLRRHGRDCHAH